MTTASHQPYPYHTSTVSEKSPIYINYINHISSKIYKSEIVHTSIYESQGLRNTPHQNRKNKHKKTPQSPQVCAGLGQWSLLLKALTTRTAARPWSAPVIPMAPTCQRAVLAMQDQGTPRDRKGRGRDQGDEAGKAWLSTCWNWCINLHYQMIVITSR